MSSHLLTQARSAIESALASGADDAVATVNDSQTTRFVYRDGKLEEVQQSSSRGLDVRLYVDGRYSTHSTTDLRDDQVKGFIQDAVSLTLHLEPDPHRVIPNPALYAGRSDADLDVLDPAVRDLPRDVCIEWLKAMDAETHADGRVVSASANVGTGWHAITQVSSNGFEGFQEGTSAWIGSSVTLDEGNGRRPEGSYYVNGRHLEDLTDPSQVGALSLQRALNRLGSTKGASSRATMVVDPEAGGRLIGDVIYPLSGGSLQQNRSFLTGMKGHPVASDKLTVIEDPLLPRGQRSRLFDGEGIAAHRMPVLEGGVLRNYYIDTYYGRKLGWDPTTGGASNLVLETGEQDLEELIGEAGEGFYVNNWLGGNSDPATGAFSFGVAGHVIENGRKTTPVSEMNITGNYLELMSNLIAVGNDPNPWSSYRTPTLVFQEVEFSGQ